MRLTFLGHAGVLIETDDITGRTLRAEPVRLGGRLAATTSPIALPDALG